MQLQMLLEHLSDGQLLYNEARTEDKKESLG